MNGSIVVIGSVVMVSNQAELDISRDIIDTPEGRRSVPIRQFKVIEPFGLLKAGEQVVLAFKADDGTKKSYGGEVTRSSEYQLLIRITHELTEYEHILRRAKKWLHQESQENCSA